MGLQQLQVKSSQIEIKSYTQSAVTGVTSSFKLSILRLICMGLILPRRLVLFGNQLHTSGFCAAHLGNEKSVVQSNLQTLCPHVAKNAGRKVSGCLPLIWHYPTDCHIITTVSVDREKCQLEHCLLYLSLLKILIKESLGTLQPSLLLHVYHVSLLHCLAYSFFTLTLLLLLYTPNKFPDSQRTITTGPLFWQNMAGQWALLKVSQTVMAHLFSSCSKRPPPPNMLSVLSDESTFYSPFVPSSPYQTLLHSLTHGLAASDSDSASP